MARVTVEDCLLIIKNRFELVALASKRAKEISSGAPIVVERDNDKDSVVALREIANAHLEMKSMRINFIESLRKHSANNQDNRDDHIVDEIIEEIDDMTQALPDTTDMASMFSDDDIDAED